MRSKDLGWNVTTGNRSTRPMPRFWLLLLLVCSTARIGYAHPMGNFSINHYAGIRVEKDAVELRYIIDQAEIPTYQQIQEAGIAAQVEDPSLRPYLARQAAVWKGNLLVEINGEPVRLATVSQTVIFPPGAGGLPTMKIGVIYRGIYHPKSREVHLRYRDDNFPGHAGWKEIVVTAAEGVDLGDARPYKLDRSAQLTNYPTDLLNSPPQDLEAAFTYTVPAPASFVAAAAPLAATSSSSPKPTPAPTAPPLGAKTSAPAASVATGQAQPDLAPTPTLVLQPNRQATPRSRFTELMASPKVGFWFLLTAALLAAGLGAMHALEPGHGKTIVAAYLVGSHGRTRHAVGAGVAGHRGAHGGGLPAGCGGTLRLAVHRSGADLSLAQHRLGPHHRSVGRLSVPARVDRSRDRAGPRCRCPAQPLVFASTELPCGRAPGRRQGREDGIAEAIVDPRHYGGHHSLSRRPGGPAEAPSPCTASGWAYS